MVDVDKDLDMNRVWVSICTAGPLAIQPPILRGTYNLRQHAVPVSIEASFHPPTLRVY